MVKELSALALIAATCGGGVLAATVAAGKRFPRPCWGILNRYRGKIPRRGRRPDKPHYILNFESSHNVLVL